MATLSLCSGIKMYYLVVHCFLTPVVDFHSLYTAFHFFILTFQPLQHRSFCYHIRCVATMLALPLLFSLSTALPLAYGAPMPLFGIHIGSGSTTDGTPTAVSQSTVDSSLLRPALFARVAYCSPASVTALSCGAPCDAINKIKVLTAGGDEAATPRCMCM